MPFADRFGMLVDAQYTNRKNNSLRMVYLGKKKTRHRLLRLLHLIFLDKMMATEKTKVLKNEYDLVLTPDMERELTEMGSLAEGIAERAKAEGKESAICNYSPALMK